jgi:hypothetical protein
MEGEELSRCKDELRALQEENRHLRQAAASFGDLAERLSDQLDRERRQSTSDGRGVERDASDRRREPPEAEPRVVPDR